MTKELTVNDIENAIEQKNGIKEMIEKINRVDVIEYLYVVVSDICNEIGLEA